MHIIRNIDRVLPYLTPELSAVTSINSVNKKTVNKVVWDVYIKRGPVSFSHIECSVKTYWCIFFFIMEARCCFNNGRLKEKPAVIATAN